MTAPVLIGYKTYAGSTGEVAEFIASVLREEGISVEVHPLREVRDVRPYRAVVLGAPMRRFRWESDVVKFLKTHREALSRIPVAYFTVCLTMQEDTEDHRRLVESWMEPARAIVPPVSVGLFAGRMDYSKLSAIDRFIIRNLMRIPEGDYRNWDAIRAWSQELAGVLKERISASTER